MSAVKNTFSVLSVVGMSLNRFLHENFSVILKPRLRYTGN